LDGLLHAVGNQSPRVPEKLREYEVWIQQLLDQAKYHYREVHLYIFSDHGMANCDQLLDLKALIDALPLKMEEDYAVVYDSTMARFWFRNDRTRTLISKALAEVPQGRILPESELADMKALFEDRYFSLSMRACSSFRAIWASGRFAPCTGIIQARNTATLRFSQIRRSCPAP
jgi:hypothetical protein